MKDVFKVFVKLLSIVSSFKKKRRLTSVGNPKFKLIFNMRHFLKKANISTGFVGTLKHEMLFN